MIRWLYLLKNRRKQHTLTINGRTQQFLSPKPVTPLGQLLVFPSWELRVGSCEIPIPGALQALENLV